METLKDIFVTYEIAQKLKEIGFDEPCIFYYNFNKEFMMQTDVYNNEEKCNYNSDRDESLVSSPTYSQVENWFIKKGEDYDIDENNKEEYILKLIEKYREEKIEADIFRVGDKVFDIRYGWGEVIDVYSKPYSEDVMTRVSFELRNETYFNDGRNYKDDKNPVLSFTEYTLNDFSQKRPINYKDYIGKWGKFFDSYDGEIVLSKLKIIDENPEYPFISFQKINYANFEPLTKEQIKMLNLE